MRIVIDARMFAWTGIGRYTRNLLRELERLDRANSYVVMLRSGDWDSYSPSAENFTKARADIEPLSVANQTKLPALLRSLEPDLVHFTHFTVPVSYRGRFVATIWDLTPLDFRNVRGGALQSLLYSVKQAVLRRVIAHAVRESRSVITTSRFVADEIATRFHVPREKIAVTYLAAEKVAVASALPGGVKKPFLLYVGNLHVHKSVGMLLETFSLLRRSRPDLHLVIVGRDEYWGPQLERRARQLSIESSTFFPGFVDDTELAALYKAAEVFVFPSMSEGFGLPPLEAMAHGCAVVSSGETSLPEVLGDAADYFDPRDPEDAARTIAALLDDATELERLRRGGPQQAARYSWPKMAEQTLAVYRSPSL